jgi:outer membrane biosynthesis protein TonB
MNALAEMPAAVRSSIAAATLPLPQSRGTYAAGLFAALGIHAAILFAWPPPSPVIEQVEFGVEMADASVEVSLVAALPAEEPAAVVETPPDPTPPEPPEPPPVAEPPPVEPVVKAEMTLPEPEPPPPAPLVKREKPRVVPKEASKPKPVTRAVGDGSSPVPGNDATTAVAASGAASAKPGYLRNPHPAYPEAARSPSRAKYPSRSASRWIAEPRCLARSRRVRSHSGSRARRRFD